MEKFILLSCSSFEDESLKCDQYYSISEIGVLRSHTKDKNKSVIFFKHIDKPHLVNHTIEDIYQKIEEANNNFNVVSIST